MQISIVTSLFNRLDLTRPFLESLDRTLRGWDYEVILIDDASTDGTREFLAGLSDPRFRVILRDSPCGFAANNNAGARIARAPLLAFLNNDLVLLPGWLEPMARLARVMPDVACVGNVQREPVSGLIDHHGFYFDADGNALHAGKNAASAPTEPYLSWPAVTAACWVIRKSVFLRLGGFDETFRNGFEDLDFCLRAGSAGYRHFVANRSTVYHHISSSPGRKQHESANVRLFQQRWRNHILRSQQAPEKLVEVTRDGWRYLHKHLVRPWRYNIGRVLDAIRKVRQSPATSRVPGWVTTMLLRLQEVVRPAAPQSTQLPARAAGSAPRDVRVYMVVSGTAGNPERCGVATFVRSLAGGFGRLDAPVGLVQWNAVSRSLALLPGELSMGLDAEVLRDDLLAAAAPAIERNLFDPRTASLHDPAANTPSLHQLPRSGDAAAVWILMPEVLYAKGQAEHLTEYVHRHGWRLALIFHDAIPVIAPEFAAPGRAIEHRDYMHFSSGADLILPVSEQSARDWNRFVLERGLPRAPVKVCSPGGDTYNHVRKLNPPPCEPSRRVRILCVSTVAARKNHRALLMAFDLAVAALPGVALELSLVGASRPAMENIPGAIHEAMARHPGKIFWYEQADYSALRVFYESSDFTVYPSVMEGFCLSILESLWFGRPCICANFGQMAATAVGGGCLTADVRNPAALAEAIIELASSPALHQRLAAESNAREIKTWNEYAAEILTSLPPRSREKANELTAAYEPVFACPAEMHS